MTMVPIDPEAELVAATDDLYGLDPAGFVGARNEVVRALRKQGRRDLASQVAGLRRPTPAAWAVNQLARRHRPALDVLLGLGEALRQAQTNALAGADARDLRRAGRSRHDAVAQLTESAVGVLAERGQVGDHHAEIAATLEAASLDPGAAALVSGGRLTSALAPPSGFGHLDDDLDLSWAHGPPAPPSSRPRTDRSTTEAAERRTEAEDAVTAAREQVTTLSADARDAADVAARRLEEVAAAEAQVGRLQRELDEATGRVTAVRRGADRAATAAELAETAAAAAVAALRRAEGRLGDPQP